MTDPTVLLIVPPNVPARDLAAAGSYQTVHLASVPMGVLSIASYCRAHVGGDWRILDLNLHLHRLGANLEGIPMLVAMAMAGRAPDVVGVSCIFNAQAGYLGPISRAARQLWPQSLIVAGGGFPTNMSLQAFRLAPDLNALCLEEGELPFRWLLERCAIIPPRERDETFFALPGWWGPGIIGCTSPATMVQNLDDIPPLAYDLIDFEQYQGVTRFHGGTGRVAIIETTRGCPNRCHFCASSTIHGHRIRRYSPERMASDVRALVDRYGIDTLVIEDDHFLGNRRHALAVLRALEPLHLSIEFPSGLAVHCIDAEIAHAMAAAGAKTATLAVESGCERVLREIIHKPWTDLSRVRKAVEVLRAEGMYIRAFFVIGNPGETLAEMEETGRFMREAGFNWVAIMIATPIAGSEYYRICRERGWLATEDLAEYHYGHCTIRTPDFEPEQVERMRYRLNLDVNFVHNHDLANGRPEVALQGFMDVLARVLDHAFGHYYASKALGQMGENDMAVIHGIGYEAALAGANSEMWRGWAREFGLPH